MFGLPRHMCRNAIAATTMIGATVGLPALAQQAADTPSAHFVQAPADDIAALTDALQLDRLLEVMRAEGIAYGDTIAEDLLGSDPPIGWDARISEIYSLGQIEDAVRAALEEALAGDDVGAMVDFLTSGPGARAVTYEIEARAARLDPEVEQAADEAAVLAIADGDPRIDLIERYIDAGDLIERNVADAMTSNYAFYVGLMQAGAMPPGVTADDLLADVWAQEELIRQTLTDWHYSFLYMAFAPLEDAEIEAYIAFAETPAGQQLNDALFVAFDVAFTDISRALGRAAGDYLSTQDL